MDWRESNPTLDASIQRGILRRVIVKPLEWNVVVPGSWNRAIFTPRFVAAEILKVAVTNMEVLVPVAESGPTVYQAEGVKIVPESTRAAIATLDPTPKGLDRARACMVALLVALPRTPIRAAGFNLRYVVEDEANAAIEALRGETALSIDAVHQTEPISWTVDATYPFMAGTLKVETKRMEGKAEHLFNFHRQTQEVEEAKAWLAIELAECEAKARKCIEAIYGGG